MTSLKQAVSLIIFIASCAVTGTTWSDDLIMPQTNETGITWPNGTGTILYLEDLQSLINTQINTQNRNIEQNLQNLQNLINTQNNNRTERTEKLSSIFKYINSFLCSQNQSINHLRSLNKKTERKVFYLNMCFLSILLWETAGLYNTLYDTFIATQRNKQQIAEQITQYTSALHTAIPRRMQSLAEQQIKPEDNNVIKPHELCKIIQFEKAKNDLLDDIEHAINQLEKIKTNNLSDPFAQQAQVLASTACGYKQRIKAIGYYKE